MSADIIRQRATDLLAHAAGIEAELSHLEWDMALWQDANQGKSVPDAFRERQSELVTPFQDAIRSLYLASVCLMDSMNLNDYLRRFSDIFEKEYLDEALRPNAAALEFTPADDWPPYPRSAFLAQMRAFLSPLGVETDSNFYRRQAGVKLLENILEGTRTILKLRRVSEIAEPKISRAVREVIEVIFPSSKKGTAGSFSTTLKKYVPDILIPELHAVVEYKLIRSKTEMDTALAGIADDATAYTGHSQYKLCFAVFFVEGYHLPQKRFMEAWKEKKFSEEWIPIYLP